MSQNSEKNTVQNTENTAYLVEALQWHLDNGVDELLEREPVDRTLMPEIPKASGELLASASSPASAPASATSLPPKSKSSAETPKVLNFQDSAPQDEMMGAAQAIIEAEKLAASCNTLEELSKAITEFEGLSVRKTATNMVFSDGNPKSAVMLVGEAPGADEDVEGKSFAGANGQLLDKILACIGLSRADENLAKSVYISNVLNWRPPGNRTPTQSEMNISLPFIERHIALIKPKALIVCGGLTAKTLLRRSEAISKLRGDFHDYKVPDTLAGGQADSIPTIATYHPAFLLRTPAQKKAVWADMLMFREKLDKILS